MSDLEDFSKWLLESTGNDDAADDRQGGAVVQKRNQIGNRNPWFIPGAWGQVSVPTRKITVPKGKDLYIVAASSHASDQEIRAGETLQQYADWVDGLWKDANGNDTVKISWEQGTGGQLRTEKTGVFNVDIKNSNYLKLTGIQPGSTNMVTVARVCRYTPADGDIFIMKGNSRADNTHGQKGEGKYDLEVKYEVTVQ